MELNDSLALIQLAEKNSALIRDLYSQAEKIEAADYDASRVFTEILGYAEERDVHIRSLQNDVSTLQMQVAALSS